ncbi:MAG: tRNA1(Val) (adenine(37)-N6)-methyltransferase [Janthinobacterium lividum]
MEPAASGTPAIPVPEESAGTLLAGRVSYRQLLRGHRSGLEPVLMAACVPARPGQRVLEGGTGAGAGLLCLCARVPFLTGLGVELDPALASLARRNLAANQAGRIEVLAADLTGTDLAAGGGFHHAFANPPWHAGTASPDAARDVARRATPGLLALWIAALCRSLRHRGTLTLALPAAALAEAVWALREAGCGGTRVLPLWPRQGVAARLVLIQGALGSRAGSTLHPGLVLHEADGRFTAQAEAVLRDAAALSIAG